MSSRYWYDGLSKKAAWFLLVLAMASLTGCLVISVHPFFQEQDLIFEPALLGRWTGHGQQWRFEPDRNEEKAYFITYTNQEKTSKMTGHLFILEDHWFLDLFGSAESETMPPPIPSHCVVRVKLSDGRLTLQSLSYEWMEKWLKKNPKALRHQWRVNPGDNAEDQYFVLLAESADLQKFLRNQLKNAEAWTEPLTLERPDDR